MIAATGLAALLVRATLSLVVVLAIVAVAYLIARRRAGGVGRAPSGPADRGRFGRRRSAPPAIEVVGRVGLTRSTAAVAVRFGERVVLIAANEQGPSNVISEMHASEWDEIRTVREPLAPAEDRSSTWSPVVVPRPSFVEALRQATARHA